MRVLVYPALFLSTLLVSSTSAYGFATLKKNPLQTSTTPCQVFLRNKTDQNMAAFCKRTMGQVHSTTIQFGKQPIFSMELASSLSLSTQEIGNTSTADLSTDVLWTRMEKVVNKIKAVSCLEYFTTKQINQQDLENLLQTKADISFQSPTTLADVVKEYVTRGGGSFIIACVLSEFLYHVSIIPLHPLGIQDVLCIVGSSIFWEAMEWTIHSSWFSWWSRFQGPPALQDP